MFADVLFIVVAAAGTMFMVLSEGRIQFEGSVETESLIPCGAPLDYVPSKGSYQVVVTP